MRTYCQASGCKHLCRRGRKWCRPCFATALRAAKDKLGVYFEDLYTVTMRKIVKDWSPYRSTYPLWQRTDGLGDMYSVPIKLDQFAGIDFSV